MSSVDHYALVTISRSEIITDFSSGLLKLFYILLHHEPVLVPDVAGPLAANGVLVNGQVWPHPLLEPDTPPRAGQLAI